MSGQSVRYRVWVGGLPREITQEDLYSRFSKYGNILDVTIRHSDSDTYSFITYAERRDAEEAIARMDRSCAWGAPVKVNISKDFPPNGPRRRGSDGKPINTPPAVVEGLRRPGSPPRSPPRRRRSPSRSRRRRGREGRRWSPGDRRRGSPGRGYGRPPPRSFSPPPARGHRPPPALYEFPPRPPGCSGRSLSARGLSPPSARRSPPPIGRHRITIENIPHDMSWLELKDLGKEYGSSVTFSRAYCRDGVFCGMLEYADPLDARRATTELDGRRIEGGAGHMRVYEGDSWRG